MMGGAWRKRDRRSSLTYSSPDYKRKNEKIDRHGNKRKCFYSPRRRDDGDDFASRRSKRRSQQSRHPPHIKRESKSRTFSKSRSRSISRNSSDCQDYRRSKCRESESRHPHQKEEHRYRNSRDTVSTKQIYEETNLDLRFFEEKQPKKSSSLKEFSKHFLEKAEKYMTQGSLKKAMKCINLALKVCKKEDKFTSILYSRRGTIFSLLEKPRCSFQGFLDWEHAFIIDKDNIEARINLSKTFFKAANKMFRINAYHRSLNLCNHALGLNVRNGEACVLFKLLKRKLLEKELKDSTSVVVKDTPTSPSLKCNPGSILVAKYELHEAVLDEVKRLNNLIGEALNTNDYPLALKYCDLALRLFKSDIPDDKVYCDLLVLKQQLIGALSIKVENN